MKKKVLMFLAVPLVAMALIATAALHPGGAGAAPVKSTRTLGTTHALGTKQHAQHLAVSSSNNLIYNGGPVMTGTTQAFAIFWEPTGSTVSATYNSLIERYFGDVGPFGLYHNNTQYTDTTGHAPTGAALKTAWVDTAAYPSGTLSDAQIQGEVTHAQAVNHWAPNIHKIFFVFTAKNENICIDSSTCSFTTFCAYHGAFGTNNVYAAMPYTGTNLSACGVNTSPNSDFDADSTINVTSHEQMEAATDPLLNAWFDATGMEIGDKCAWTFGTLNAQGGDVVWHHHSYIVQQEWDNHVGGCVVKGP